MSRGDGRTTPAGLIVWALLTALLLATAFLSYVAIASVVLARSHDPESVRATRQALALYASVVLVKGLLPQLIVTVALWPLAERRLGLATRSWRANALALVALAGLASLVALPILASGGPGLSAVRFAGPGNALRTALELTAGLSAAALVAKLAIARLRGGRARRAPPVLAP